MLFNDYFSQFSMYTEISSSVFRLSVTLSSCDWRVSFSLIIETDKHFVWWNSMCFKIIKYLQISNIVPSSRIKTECWNRYDNWLFIGYWLLFMKNIYCIKGSYLWWLFEDLSLADSHVADTNSTKVWNWHYCYRFD